MKDAGAIVLRAARVFGAALLTFCLWIVWTALAVLLIAQLYIRAHHELEVPAFVLRRLEARLENAGLRVTFDRATLDPTGSILVRAPKFFLPGYPEPVATARAAYVRLEPWPLTVGHVQVRQVRIVEGAVFVSATLSPSGLAEPLAREIEAIIEPADKVVHVRQLSARVGNLDLSVHGDFGVAPMGPSGVRWSERVRTEYRAFCTSAIAALDRLKGFEQPYVDITLTSFPDRRTIASLSLGARGVKLTQPYAVEATGLHASTDFPLGGTEPILAEALVSADAVRVPGRGEARRVSAVLRGRVTRQPYALEPLAAEVTVASVTTPDGAAESLFLTAEPLSPSSRTQWKGAGVVRALESTIGFEGNVDLAAKTARARIDASVAPRLLDVISAHSHVDVRKFFDFRSAEVANGTVEIGPGWKFQHATAHVWLHGIEAHGVNMDEGRAFVIVDPQQLYSPDAYATIGPNFARGTYEHVFATRQFRFLLDGRLRPMDISGWFHDWWSKFFSRFEFPLEPPVASVDVQGFWREGRRTSVFVFADTNAPVIQREPLKRVRTRIFIRPGFYDGLELFATRGVDETAQGTFAVSVNMDNDLWRSVDVDASSTFALEAATRMMGPLGEPVLSPFSTALPPTVKVSTHFDGPDVQDVRHRMLKLEAKTSGRFEYNHLPFEDAAFTVQINDDDIAVDSTHAKFAGGALEVHAKVSGTGAGRKIGFSGGLHDASLGVAAAQLQTFLAEKKGQPPPAPGKFIKERANVRIDLTASGEGPYGNPLGLHGAGNALLRGPEIGEVPLFGPLSELLKFTALRFTSAKSSFRINGSKIEFPDFALRGANSAIDAHGEYALDRRQLDFRAKIFPFQESGGVLKTVVGAVLTPISNVLEVKLTGSLESPDWAFVMGPTNLLRSLAPDQPQPAAPAAPSQAPGATPESAPAAASAQTASDPKPADAASAQDH